MYQINSVVFVLLLIYKLF